MKKFLFTMIALFGMTVSSQAMSYEQARQQALFLADKMAYELNLTEEQYEACYEVNLDYFMRITSVDDLYGDYWTRRNLDLSYILFDWQYQTFLSATYFYRPIYWSSGYWHFGIYARYPHRDYYYFGRPAFWSTYRGGHSWHSNGGRSWYHGRSFSNRGYNGNGNRGRDDRYQGMRDGYNNGSYGRGRNYRDGDSRHNYSIGRGQSSTRSTVGTRGMTGSNRSTGTFGTPQTRVGTDRGVSTQRESGSFNSRTERPQIGVGRGSVSTQRSTGRSTIDRSSSMPSTRSSSVGSYSRPSVPSVGRPSGSSMGRSVGSPRMSSGSRGSSMGGGTRSGGSSGGSSHGGGRR